MKVCIELKYKAAPALWGIILGKKASPYVLPHSVCLNSTHFASASQSKDLQTCPHSSPVIFKLDLIKLLTPWQKKKQFFIYWNCLFPKSVWEDLNQCYSQTMNKNRRSKALQKSEEKRPVINYPARCTG